MNRAGLIGVAACVMLVGCGAGDEVEKAFSAKYAKDLCIEVADSFPLSITYQNDISEAPEATLVQALVKEGLLTPGAINQVGTPPAIMNTATFDLNDQGRTYLRENQLCYGKTEVDRVLTTREYGDGTRRFLDAQVLLRHVVTAPWASNPDLKQHIKSGREVVERTLSHSDEGWLLK